MNNIEGFKENWIKGLDEIIKSGLDGFVKWYKHHEAEIDKIEQYELKEKMLCLPYSTPSKIWGIGLNYVEHAEDLKEKAPQMYPASFMRPSTSSIGNNETIQIPVNITKRTTGEAELGIIIGKTAKNINQKDWKEYVAGFCPIIDCTAEDILKKNPRYLTLSKSFDTFFSFGPEIVTKDEIDFNNFHKLKVSTVHNGEIHVSNIIGNMTFSPAELLAFHSSVMTLYPGDIISTGTPGAVRLNDGDIVESRIDGFRVLKNKVEFV